jgi:hypothetical protein
MGHLFVSMQQMFKSDHVFNRSNIASCKPHLSRKSLVILPIFSFFHAILPERLPGLFVSLFLYCHLDYNTYNPRK